MNYHRCHHQRRSVPGLRSALERGSHEQCTHLKSIRRLTNELYNLQSHVVPPDAFSIAKMYHNFADMDSLIKRLLDKTLHDKHSRVDNGKEGVKEFITCCSWVGHFGLCSQQAIGKLIVRYVVVCARH